MAERVKSVALRPPLIFGWNIRTPGTNDLLRIIKIMEHLGVCFASLNLNSAAGDPEETTFVPLCGSDLVLTYNYWSQRIVAKIDDIDTAFKPYMEWTAYVGLRAVCITCEYVFREAKEPNEVHETLANMAQMLKSFVNSPNVPTVCLSFAANDVSWGYWSAIYEMTNYSPQLRVAILLDDDNLENVERWMAEPVTAIILRENAFVKNGDSVHVSEKIAPHLKYCFNFNVKIMLSGDFNFHLINEASQLRSCDSLELLTLKDLETPAMEDGIGIREAISAIKAIYATMPPLTEADKFREGFLDLLQEPLQPVRDNLDTVTYEHFEKCTRKYSQYETAIDLWLKDYLAGNVPSGKCKEGNQDSESPGGENMRIPVIYIVGAGRGPLVDCVLRALAKNNVISFSVYALEKNPATIFTLKHKIATNAIPGWNKVKLIFQDMRTFKPPEAADLVISELMGSFGDNELAPECLDGIQNVFHSSFPEHQVTFIPCSYTSYAEPIYAPKVWSSLHYTHVEKPFEHPYTVALHKIYKIAEHPRPCFKFEHPNTKLKFKYEDDDELQGNCEADNAHNDRYICMKYKAKIECFINGFAGYFECTLYKDIKLSTIPGVMDDQISWFPIYFPLMTPVYVKESQLIMIHVWRKHDRRRMWYEWALTLPHVTAVHNAHGSCHSILR